MRSSYIVCEASAKTIAEHVLLRCDKSCDNASDLAFGSGDGFLIRKSAKTRISWRRFSRR